MPDCYIPHDVSSTTTRDMNDINYCSNLNGEECFECFFCHPNIKRIIEDMRKGSKKNVRK